MSEIGPIVLFSDLTECLPYDDSAIALWVTGAQLKTMILYMLRDEVWDGTHCEFFQFSKGVRVSYNKQKHAFKEFSLYGEQIEARLLSTTPIALFLNRIEQTALSSTL